LRQERRQRLALQSRLLPGSPLITHRLLLLNPPDGFETHTSRRLHPSPRLLRWMMQDSVSLAEGATLIDTTRRPFIPQQALDRLSQITGSLNTPITVAVVGGTMGLREGVSMAIARMSGRPLVRVDMERCKSYLEHPYDLIRDLRLDGAIPFVINVPDTDDEPQLRMQMMNVGTALATLPYPVIAGGNDRRAMATMIGQDRPNVTVPVG